MIYRYDLVVSKDLKSDTTLARTLIKVNRFNKSDIPLTIDEMYKVMKTALSDTTLELEPIQQMLVSSLPEGDYTPESNVALNKIISALAFTGLRFDLYTVQSNEPDDIPSGILLYYVKNATSNIDAPYYHDTVITVYEADTLESVTDMLCDKLETFIGINQIVRQACEVDDIRATRDAMNKMNIPFYNDRVIKLLNSFNISPIVYLE
jgi:hypothetical protein